MLTLHDRMFPGNVVLFEKFQHFYLLSSLFVAAELDLAGLLKNGEKSAEQLAAESGTDTESLYRILRSLASQKIFREGKNRQFRNTRLSRSLIDGEGSLRQMLRHHLGKVNWQIMGESLDTVRTGKDGFIRIHHKDIYSYLSGDPESSRIFGQSMSELSSLGMLPLLQAYRFSGIHTLADIGGGEGFLLANILMVYPAMQGILFDQAAALENATAVMQEFGVEERVKRIEGNFLESIPEGADGYILKNVLHNWDDKNCVDILSSIRKVMPDKGKVLIVEMVVPEGNTASTAKMIDIQMLASMPGGKERTKKEFEAILLQSGLRLNHEFKTIAPVSILEAQRIN